MKCKPTSPSHTPRAPVSRQQQAITATNPSMDGMMNFLGGTLRQLLSVVYYSPALCESDIHFIRRFPTIPEKLLLQYHHLLNTGRVDNVTVFSASLPDCVILENQAHPTKGGLFTCGLRLRLVPNSVWNSSEAFTKVQESVIRILQDPSVWAPNVEVH